MRRNFHTTELKIRLLILWVEGLNEKKKYRAQIMCEYISLQEDDDLFPTDGRAALEELTEDDMENEVYFTKHNIKWLW